MPKKPVNSTKRLGYQQAQTRTQKASQESAIAAVIIPPSSPPSYQQVDHERFKR